jgi:hypothetical protein
MQCNNYQKDSLTTSSIKRLYEQRQSAYGTHIEHAISVPYCRTSLQSGLRRRLRAPIPTRRRRLRGVDILVARNRARASIRTRCGDQLHAANLGAAGRVRGQEGAAAGIRLGTHFAGCRCELRGGRDGCGAPLGIGGGADYRGPGLDSSNGRSGGVGAGKGHGDRGGDLAEDGGGFDDGLADRVGCGLLDGYDDGAIGCRGCSHCRRGVACGRAGLGWRGGAAILRWGCCAAFGGRGLR